jgi:predicted Zn-dependent protease
MRCTKRIIAIAIALLIPVVVLAADKDDKDNKKAKDDVEKIGERDVDGSINLYSIEKEIQMGKQYADEIERQVQIIDDPIVAEYINRLGQNLVRHSDAEVPFSFKVIASPQVNAFALPGGFCFVHSGLILEAETEAEVAGVLAHEIAHVAARHGTRQATRSTIANIGMIPVVILTGGWGGYAIQQASGLMLPLAFTQFSRSFEREADYLGLQYLYAAGYDPTSFVDFFEKLAAMQKTKPNAFASVFASHPMTDDRIEAAQAEMSRILPTKSEYLINTSEFDHMRERLDQLLNPEKRLSRLDDAPRVRRGRDVGVIAPEERTSTIEKPDEEGEEDDRPVLRRQP